MCDYPRVFDSSEVKARKQHRCVECRTLIAKGERYVRHKGIWDDGPNSLAICLPCESLWDAVWTALRANNEDCLQYGELWEAAQEYEVACRVNERWRWEEAQEEIA